MEFLFFRADDTILFSRSDAESGRWTVHEMTLTALFPYDPDKPIERGQRVGFEDPSGSGFQFFEIRKVLTLEPDHYQEITAEHIAISELTDCHIGPLEFGDIPVQQAVGTVLQGTGWSVGTVTVGDLAEQQAIKNQIAALNLNGNVDLTDRPIVSAEQLRAAGYTDYSGGSTGLFPQIYAWEPDENTTTATLLVTPIRHDGTIFGPDRLSDYMIDLYERAGNYAGIKAADTDGMLIHYLPGDQESAIQTISDDAADLSYDWQTCIKDVASSADLSMGSVWQDICTIRDNWNVLIKPRVTYNASGITGRYIDIVSNQPIWRGVRLSINKNADDMGVTYDDTNLFTAMYGYGASVDSDISDQSTPLTFDGVTWAETADHPAKPAGQAYIESPTATALYGRNGRARFGFYQNSDIRDAEILLQKTWESLKTQMEPAVTIDCTVQDLHRMGYADQPLQINDLAIIDIEPIGAQLRRTIIQMEVDIIDPSATRLVIGTYIPNIIYINHEVAVRSGGGGGGGRSKESQSTAEYKRSEFESDLISNNYEFSIRAYQNDLDTTNDQLRQAEITVEAQGVRITAAEGNILSNKTDIARNKAEIQVNSNSISQIVTSVGDNGQVTAASIVTAINNDGTSNVAITADHIQITGNTGIIGKLSTQAVTVNSLTIDNGGANLGNANVYYNSRPLGTVVDGLAVDQNPPAGKIGFTYTTLGGGSGTINFNIADTQTYIDGVSAARLGVTVDTVTVSNITASASARTASATFRVTLSNGVTKDVNNVDVSAVYQAGLDGTGPVNSKSYDFRLVDENGAFVRTRQKSVNVSAVYQKGVDDSAVTKYAYSSSGAKINVQSSPRGESAYRVGYITPNTPVTFLSYSSGGSYSKVHISYTNNDGVAGDYWIINSSLHTTNDSPSNFNYLGWESVVTPVEPNVTSVTLTALVHPGSGMNSFSGSLNLYMAGKYTTTFDTRQSVVNANYDNYASTLTKVPVNTYFNTVSGTYYASHNEEVCDGKVTHKATLTVYYSDGTNARRLIEFISDPV